jgi:phosphoribosylformimino-5-aminoimidazole carboxamide ribonucleotide (ProFAR) isomerase
MGFFKFLLGLKDVEVNGNMHVSTLQESFAENFGTQLRIYSKTSKGINTGKGARPAASKATLASVSIDSVKVSSMTIKKNNTVGEIEDQFAKKMGIGIQIASPDGKKLAPNNIKLQDVAKEMS